MRRANVSLRWDTLAPLCRVPFAGEDGRRNGVKVSAAAVGEFLLSLLCSGNQVKKDPDWWLKGD